MIGANGPQVNLRPVTVRDLRLTNANLRLAGFFQLVSGWVVRWAPLPRWLLVTVVTRLLAVPWLSII
jgi:hypothetical protein